MGRRLLPPLLALLLLAHPSIAQDKQSAFQNVVFGTLLSVDLPRDWAYLDTEIAKHLNTASEAMGQQAGIAIRQGDNHILVAGNARDSKGQTMATLRVSVREAATTTQAELRAAQDASPQEVQRELEAAGNEIVKSTLRIPIYKSTRLVSTGMVSNRHLLCMWSQFEQDIGKGPFISDQWVCPVGARTIKLTTTYQKALESIYKPTVDRLWNTLKERA